MPTKRPPTLERLLGIEKPRKITRPEDVLLREKLRVEARGSKRAVAQFKRDQIFLASLTKDIEKELAKPKGKQRSVISFIKQLGEMKQTVIQDIKKELGITKSIKEMNLTELNDFVGKMKERLKFKFERGFRPASETVEKLNLKIKDTPKPEFTDDFYQANRTIQKEITPTRKERIIELVKSIGKGSDVIAGSLSTRFGNISPELKLRLRKFRFDTRQRQQTDAQVLQNFLLKKKKMTSDELIDFDLAAKNGDIKKINELSVKYGMEDELAELRKGLDGLYKRANEVGFDIGYQAEYFPRTLKDPMGLMEFVRKSDDWGFFNEGIRRKEMDLGRYLNEEEKAHLINAMLRGYRGGNITLSRTGAMKERVIDTITPEMNQFYDSVDDALLKYVNVVNEKIEAARFFGKKGSIKDTQGIPTKLDDSVGAFLADELTKGRITPQQELELREMLQTLFNPKGTSGLMGVFKDLGYIDTLGDFRAAITQLGDMGLSLYVGGIKKGLLSSTQSLLGKAKITKEELGFAAEEISAEFTKKSTTRQALDTVLRLTGFRKMDKVGAEGLPNAYIMILRDKALKNDPLLKKELEEMFPTRLFPEGTIDNVIDALERDEATDDVKFLAFNKLLDFSPRDIIEMPEQYIKGGNGRIFYMLKSWTLKLFDIYRREVFQQMKTNKKDGLKNFLRLTTFLTVLNATADEIKDFISGRETKLSDRVIDTFAKLAGFSKYSFYQAQRDGLGSTVLEQLIPPTPTIDDVSRDVYEIFNDPNKSFEINELRSIKSIPIGGDLYYWWFGKGVKSPSKKKTGLEIPSIEIPSINIPSVNIPSISL